VDRNPQGSRLRHLAMKVRELAIVIYCEWEDVTTEAKQDDSKVTSRTRVSPYVPAVVLFIYGLFNDALCISDYKPIASNGRMVRE
jgi:hypothetical protein